MICVCIGRGRHKHMMAEHTHLVEQGAKLVELRLDYISGEVNLKRLLENRPGPVLISCRRPADGGKWSGSEAERLVKQAVLDGRLGGDDLDAVRREKFSSLGSDGVVEMVATDSHDLGDVGGLEGLKSWLGLRGATLGSERAQQMGRAARARIEHVFHWRDAAAGLADVLAESVRAAHRRPRAA